MVKLPSQNPRKNSILMISGSGRSGTTILSLLLSQSTDAHNVGQIRNLWQGYAKNVTCVCGSPLRTCSFWGVLRQQLYPDYSEADFLQTMQLMLDFKAEAASLSDWSDKTELAALARSHDIFLKLYRNLLDAVFEQTGAQFLVDSSKSPEIALAAQLVGIADIYVLNVVRDPRAVACSWQKKGADVAKMMEVWRNRQVRLSNWAESSRLKHRQLRYEDFVAEPVPALQGVLNWIGSNLLEGVIDANNIAHINWDNQHLFPPANEKVLAEKRAIQEIKAPQDWRLQQNNHLHEMALHYTSPIGIDYVQNLKSQTGFESG